ncbi:MAG: hypothetical protein NUV57_02430 [archaeon]|nr:hypothetical protein [archaeon]
MEVIFSRNSQKDLDSIDSYLRKLFFLHAEKISANPTKKHLRHGLPFFAEKVTKQARIVYNFSDESLLILRCFKTHKQYEKWYKKQ